MKGFWLRRLLPVRFAHHLPLGGRLKLVYTTGKHLLLECLADRRLSCTFVKPLPTGEVANVALRRVTERAIRSPLTHLRWELSHRESLS